MTGTRRTGPFVAAVMSSAVLLSACGGSSHSASSAAAAGTSSVDLNTKRVALSITQSIRSERRLHAKVTCPPRIPQQKGLTFTCVATTHSHKKPVHTLFTVFQKDDAGNVYYQSPK